MKGVTKRQDEVLDFIKEFLLRNKFPPTIREIANNFEISVKGAYDHIKALEKKGFIHCNQNRSRAIEVLADTDEDSLVVSVPILGRVAAGIPILAEENLDGTMLLPQDFLGKGPHFALRVKGDSMTGVGIMDGDLAVIRSQATAENGEIVVAMTDEDAVTLKRYYKERSRVKLQAENPAYNPIYAQGVRILGKTSQRHPAVLMAGVWLLLGPEHGQKQDFLTELKSSLTKKFGEAPETHRFYAFETSFSDVLSLLQNGDLFAAHKLIVVQNADEYKKSDIDMIKGYAAKPAGESTLVLVSDETKADALGRAVPKDQTKVFWEMFENQKKGWVIGHFRSIGMTLDGDAAEFFLEMVDNSTDQIRLEAQKLLAFFGSDARVTLDNLEEFLVHTKEENVFTLFERIAAQEFAKGLEVLKKILSSKESEGVGLLAGLTWQFKNLLAFQGKLRDRIPAEEAFTALKVFGKKAQANMQTGARHYSSADLQSILVLTADFDHRLRQYRTEHHSLLMELYLYYVILKHGRATEAPEFGWQAGA